MVNALSRKQKDLTTARKKILASRQRQLIKKGNIYPPLKTPNSLEMENPPEVRPSRPNTPREPSGIGKKVTGQKILVGANKESQRTPGDTQGTGKPPQARPTKKLEGFKLVLGILGEN